MTVLCDRARFGARSVLRALIFGAVAMLSLFATGCGDDQFSYGTAVITFTNTQGAFPAYIAEIDQIYLTRTDSKVVYPLLQPEVFDIANLKGTT